MSFATGKRLDVVITIMKTAQCCFVSRKYAKGEGPNFFSLDPIVKLYRPPSKPWRRPCQGETVKVNGRERERPRHHLQKSTRQACCRL